MGREPLGFLSPVVALVTIYRKGDETHLSVYSPFLNIVTRATTGEREPNGFLPKLRGVPYEFWGYKNKINSF